MAEESKEEEAALVDEVAKDNLEIMLEIIMIIRNDGEFAKSIYANCPRLQHLLDQKPDLRPIFEEQSLVRINFEQVFKNAGGVLPEDQPSWYARTLLCVVKHPLFKVLRFLLLIKKVYSCVMGGAVSFLRSILCFLCSDQSAGAVLIGDTDPDNNRNGVGDIDNPEHEANKLALNNAADYMEDPEVQERVQTILHSDPDQMDELIEADPELRALRDSNPLCAELMSNPDTMKILVEPDNLRALADAPGLIEMDFANPDWTPPDVEQGEFDDGGGTHDVQGGGLLKGNEQGITASDESGGLFDGLEPDAEGVEGIEILDEYEPGEIEENSGVLEGYEQGDIDEAGEELLLEGYEPEPQESEIENTGREDIGSNEVEAIETEAEERKGKIAKGKESSSRSKSKQEEDGTTPKGGGGGFLASLGAGLVDYVAASTIGTTVGELVGNDGDFLATAEQAMLGGAEDAADDVAAAADETETAAESTNASLAANAAMMANIATGDDAAENLEGTLDSIEQAHDKQSGATTTSSTVPPASRQIDLDKAGEVYTAESAAVQSPTARGGIFAVGASYLAALKTEAKEYIAGTLLGDDIGELLVERMEADGEQPNEDHSATKPSSETRPTSRPTKLEI